MKTMRDVNTRLKGELDQWFVKQSRDNFREYHLYYTETTPGHDGGISILSEAPPNPDVKLACAERINGFLTVDQNFRKLQDICRHLPILEM